MKTALILIFGSCLSGFAGEFTIPLAPATDDRGSTSIANASYDYFTCNENPDSQGVSFCSNQYPYKTDAPQQVGTSGFEVTRSVTLLLPTGYVGWIDAGTSVAIDNEWGIQQSASSGWDVFEQTFLESVTVSSGGASMFVGGGDPPIFSESFLTVSVLTPDIVAALNAGDPLVVSVDEFLGASGASQLAPDTSSANPLTESIVPCGFPNQAPGSCTISEYLESAQLSIDPSLTATLTMQTPLPEPGSILLCCAALPIAGLVVRRRRQIGTARR